MRSVMRYSRGEWRGLENKILKPEQNTHSEQPKTDVSRVKTSKTYADVVSRQAAIDAFDCTDELIVGGEANAQNVVNYINKVVGKIETLSSAQPEVIRCKDCKDYQTDWETSYPNRHYCATMDSFMP